MVLVKSPFRLPPVNPNEPFTSLFGCLGSGGSRCLESTVAGLQCIMEAVGARSSSVLALTS